MYNWRSALAFIVSVFISTLTSAQDAPAGLNNTGVMESNGKIYVVLVVVLIILSGLIFYVARLDNKLSRLEKSDNT